MTQRSDVCAITGSPSGSGTAGLLLAARAEPSARRCRFLPLTKGETSLVVRRATQGVVLFDFAFLILNFALLASGCAADKAPAVFLEEGKTASDYRNLALNPKATATAEATSYPHATSNSEYNKKEFAARCAIDGKRDNKDVHGCGSWGPQIAPDIWWKVDFGRPVEIDKLVIFLRAAWGHDSYWKEAVIEFSDGSTEKLSMKKVAEGQEFPIAKRKVTWLKVKDLKAEEPKWCAICEFEAWGKDAP